MVYNEADQLTLWPGMHSYTYYGDGSLKEVRNPAGTQVLRSYTYTGDGLLSSASYSGRTSTFTWDGDKNRAGMEMNGGTYSFVYDRTAGIPAVIEEVKDGGTPVFYFREPGGELIARMQGTNWHFYHFDALGSTRLLTDGSGNATDRYAYDTWGKVLAHEKYAGSIDQLYQYVGQLGYYTHHQDAEFGLLQLGVRFYDNNAGIFTQRDPAEYGPCHYDYSLDRPLTITDPSGQIPLIVIRCMASPLCRSLVGCAAVALGTGAWSLFDDIINSRRIDWNKAGRHAICGCIAGALLFNFMYEPGVKAVDPILKAITGTALTAWLEICKVFVDCPPGRRRAVD